MSETEILPPRGYDQSVVPFETRQPFELSDEVWTAVSKKRLPFGRSVEPEDIGRAVVFLCGAEMISGIVLPVTGGDDLRRSG